MAKKSFLNRFISDVQADLKQQKFFKKLKKQEQRRGRQNILKLSKQFKLK